MDFFFLILLTGIILIRPEEIIPDLAGSNLYLWTLILTGITCLPKLQDLFQLPNLARRSIAVCVLGLLVSVAISTVCTKRYTYGEEILEGFVKVVAYYFLAVAILDTPERLKRFLGWLVPLTLGVGLVAALNYHEIVKFPESVGKTLEESKTDPITGETKIIKRAVASGIFNDPNDLSLILVLGMLCAFYQAMATSAPSARVFWLVPLVPLFYVMTLTGSRGGMLSLLAGFATIVYAFVGFRIGLPLAAVGALGLLALAGGRGADISGGGTARARLNLWGEGISTLFRYPMAIPYGLGPGWYQFDQGEGLVAHNSFIHTYVEYGILGGGFFLVMFLTVLTIADGLGRKAPAPPWAIAMRPAMLGILVAYAVGCFSLSAHLKLPTYLVLAIGTAYLSMCGDPPPRYIVSRAWWRWVLLVMVFGFIALKLFTQLLGQAGV